MSREDPFSVIRPTGGTSMIAFRGEPIAACDDWAALPLCALLNVGYWRGQSHDPWGEDAIQFPRLLCEIVATQVLDVPELGELMDLGADDVDELFERALRAWEGAKARSQLEQEIDLDELEALQVEQEAIDYPNGYEEEE